MSAPVEGGALPGQSYRLIRDNLGFLTSQVCQRALRAFRYFVSPTDNDCRDGRKDTDAASELEQEMFVWSWSRSRL